MSSSSDENQKSSSPGMVRLILSVMAAAIGVQNKKNLEEDFKSSSPLPFIVAGILFTVVFVFSLIFIVSLVLR